MDKVDQDYYKFKISFKGQLVENSVDAYDVANTILATSAVLQEISKIRYGEDTAIKININAFTEGSLETQCLILLDSAKETAAALIPVGTTILQVGKSILDGYKTYIDIKKFLKGKPPKETKILAGNNIQITSQDNSSMTVNYYDFRTLQSNTIAKNAAKAIQPLTKLESSLDEIDLSAADNDTKIEIPKEVAGYIESIDSFQSLPEVKYKGVISKIDTKARSGYIDIGKKRLPFSYPKGLSHDEFLMMVKSLEQKIQIFLVGEVLMDYESNPKSMSVTGVESEIKLF